MFGRIPKSGRVPVSGRVPASGRVPNTGRVTLEEAQAYHTSPAWEYLLAQSGFRVAWWAKDADPLLMRAINPYFVEGRNVFINANFSGTNWAAVGGAWRHTSGATNNLTQNNIATVGKAYKLVFTVSNRTAGSVTSSSGNNRSTNATFTEYLIAGSVALNFTPSSTFDGDVTINEFKQVNIRPSTDFPYPTGRLNIVENGDIAFQYGWALGVGWSYVGNKLVHTPGTGSAAAQAPGIVAGKSYDVTYRVTGRTAGTVNVSVGSTGTGAIRSTNSTFTETVVASGTNTFNFTCGSAFDGAVDLISCVPTDSLLLFNGDGSTTTGWTANNGASLSSVSNKLRIARAATASASASQSCLIIGRRYRVEAVVNGDGVCNPSLFIGGVLAATGTLSTSPQTLIGVAIAGSAAVAVVVNGGASTNYVEMDSISAVEINPLDGIISGALLTGGRPEILGGYAFLFDGINDYINIYSAELNSIFSPEEFWLISAGKFNTPSVSTQEILSRISAVNNTNEIRQRKSAASNVNTFYAGGGVSIQQSQASPLSEPVLLDTYAHIADGELNSAFQGVSFISSPSPLAIDGNLLSTGCNIGATTTSGTASINGEVYFVALLKKKPTPTERRNLALKLGLT